MKIIGTESELQDIIQVCDIALRASGVRAYEVVTRIQQAVEAGKAPQAKPEANLKEGSD